jgi:hypothetical protein
LYFKDESTQLVKDETKKPSPTGSDEIVNVPTIQIDTPVDYNSNQPLPSSVIDLVKSRLPTLDQVNIIQRSISHFDKLCQGRKCSNTVQSTISTYRRPSHSIRCSIGHDNVDFY